MTDDTQKDQCEDVFRHEIGNPVDGFVMLEHQCEKPAGHSGTHQGAGYEWWDAK